MKKKQNNCFSFLPVPNLVYNTSTNTYDNFKTYQDNLLSIFSNIKQHYSDHPSLPPILYSFLKTYSTIIRKDNQSQFPLNADKYIPYIKLALDINTQNTSLIDIIITNIYSLYKDKLLSGHTLLKPNLSFLIDKNIQIINLLIKTVTKIQNANCKSNMENILNLLTLIYNLNESKLIINNESYGCIISFCLFVYNNTYNLNDINDKACLLFNNIVHKMFEKMEFLTNDNIIKQSDFYNSLFTTNNNKNSNVNKYSSLHCATALNIFINRRITCLLDQIEIAFHKEGKPTLNDLQLVPQNLNEIMNNKKYMKLSKVKLNGKNKEQSQPGFFGWCYICRTPADHYDIDTRLPICSLQCKVCIQQENKNLMKYFNNELTTNEEFLDYYFNVCNEIFIILCKSLNFYSNTKSKLICIEMLQYIIEHYGKCIQNSNCFIQTIKTYLIETLMKECFINSNEFELFKKALRLYFTLWNYFKLYIKKENAIINENIFIKLLHSNKTHFEIKLIILNHLEHQYKKDKNYFESYMNTNNNNMFLKQLITSLYKIIKSNYPLNQTQIITIKVIQTIIIIIKSLMNFALMRKYEMCPYNQKDKVNYNKDLTISILKEEQYARDIANYIIQNNAHLNKEHIGEIISNGNIKLNINILMHYLNEFDFKENYLIKALSDFLNTFRLPDEIYKIENILQLFSNKYYLDNPNMFANKSIIYSISFAIVSYELDKCNLNIKSKMTFDSFMNLIYTEINPNDISRDTLFNIYKEIQNKNIILNKNEPKVNMHLCLFDNVKRIALSLWEDILNIINEIILNSHNYEVNVYSLSYEGIIQILYCLDVLNLFKEKEYVMKRLCNYIQLNRNCINNYRNIECIKVILKYFSVKNTPLHLFNNCWKIVIIDVICKLQIYIEQNKSQSYMKNDLILQLISKEYNTQCTNMKIFFTKINEHNIYNIYTFIVELCNSIEKEVSQQSSNNIIIIFLLNMLFEMLFLNLNINSHKSNRLLFHKLYIYCLVKISNIILNLHCKLLSQIQQKQIIISFKSFCDLYLNISTFNQTILCEYILIIFKDIIIYVINYNPSSKQFVFDFLKEIITKYISNKSNISLNIDPLLSCIKLYINEYIENTFLLIIDIINKLINSNAHNKINSISTCLCFIVNFYNDKTKQFQNLITNTLHSNLSDIINNKSLLFHEQFFNNIMDNLLMPILNYFLTQTNNNITSQLIQKEIQFIFNLMKTNTLFVKTNLHKLIIFIKQINLSDNIELSLTLQECFNLFINENVKQLVNKFQLNFLPLIIFNSLYEILESTSQKGFFIIPYDELNNPNNINKYFSFISSLVLKSALHYKTIKNIESYLKIYNSTFISNTQIKQLRTLLKESYENAIKFNLNFQIRKAILKYYLQNSNNQLWLIIQQDISIKLYYSLLNNEHDKDEAITSSLEIINYYLNELSLIKNEVNEEWERFSDVCDEDYTEGEEIIKEDEDDDVNEYEDQNERKNLIYHLMLTLGNVVLPKLKDIKYWTCKKYRKVLTEMLIKCVEFADKGMNKILEDILLCEFNDRYT